MKRLGIGLLVFAACNGQSKVTFKPDFATPAPPALVYKTRADYIQLVPVMLSEDKTEIVSYPHPSDVSNRPVPTQLAGGYLLDNRGIGKNVAFLRLTYEEYAKLDEAPKLTELYDLIIDKDPLTELCNCGNKKAIKKPEEELNELIAAGKLREICRVEK